MTYQVLARKWRPNTFDEVVGQDYVVKALKGALDLEKLPHAFIFSGTRGTGKTTLARILAKAINCSNSKKKSQPCRKCDSCLSIENGSAIDFQEVDAASRRGVEETKELLDSVPYLPTSSPFKIYLLDEIHMLSKESFNSLLKTLEEPPEHVVFLFATTEIDKVPPTVLSRCVQFNLSAMKVDNIKNQLQLIFDEEKIKYDENSLIKLSSLARGSMRDALTLSEKVISFSEGKITEKKVEELMGLPSSELIKSILKSIIGKDSKKLIENIEEVKINFYDPEQILIDLLSLIQEVALSQFDEKADLSDLTVEPHNLQLIYDLGISNLEYFKLSPKPESLLTMTFLKMIAFLPESSKKKSLNTNKDEANFSWPEDFSNLDLSKLTAQFMSHASMIEYHDSEMHFGINQERLNIITENQIKEVEDALSILLKKKLKVSFKPSDLTETPFEFEKIKSQKESKQAEDDLKKDSSLNEMLEKFDGKIKKVSKI